jgi:hypothetical protein
MTKKHKRQFPASALFAGAAGTAAAHGLGYLAGGVALKALPRTRLGNTLRRMSPAARKQLFARIGMGSAVLGSGALAVRQGISERRIRSKYEEMNKRADMFLVCLTELQR